MNYDLDKLKQQYIGQSYNWLTVIDVIRDDKYIKFICQCKCGNIKTIPWNKVKSGHTKSCGCYKTSNEFANNQRQYILDRPVNLFQIILKSIMHGEITILSKLYLVMKNINNGL